MKKAGKKRIDPVHVIEALEALDFRDCAAWCRQHVDKHAETVRDKPKKIRHAKTVVTQEDLDAQRALFAAATEVVLASPRASDSKPPSALGAFAAAPSALAGAAPLLSQAEGEADALGSDLDDDEE